MASKSNNSMRNSGIPMPSSRSHGSSRQKLKQRLDRTPGMLLLHEQEEQKPEGVVHRTSSATRNFFGSLSGLRQLASRGPRSWLIRDASVSSDMNGLDTESNASSFGSVSAFGSRFGSTVDLAGLIGLEDLAVSGTPHEVGSQNTHPIFLRSQLESLNRRNSGEFEPAALRHSGDDPFSDQRDDEIASEQFAIDGLVPTTENFGGSMEGPSTSGDDNHLSENAGISVQEGIELRQQESAAVKIQSSFRASRVRASVRAMRAAAVTIQRLFRGHRARIAYKVARERVVTIQAWARTMKARKQYWKLRNTVVTLQKLWMAAKQRRLEAQKAAATRIQSFYRGCSARKVYKETIRRVVLLQACARRQQAQKRYQDLLNTVLFLQRTRRSAIQQCAAVQRGKQEQALRLQQRMQECAAVKIQAFYRGWVARKSYRAEIGWVVRLQACVRRNQARQRLQSLRNAVCTIQRAWRFHKIRQAVLQRENQAHAAVRIQSAYRGWAARKSYMREVRRVVVLQSCVRRNGLSKEYRKLRTSTLTIQRAWRKSRTRRLRLRVAEQGRAAVKIQAVYRGHVVRKQYIADVIRLVKLQARIRRMQAMVLYKKMRIAVLIIQRAWQTHKTRRLQMQVEEEWGRAALRIQSLYRGHLARKRHRSDVTKVVQLQGYVRKQQAQNRYWQLRNAAVLIQRAWRAARSRKLRAQREARERAAVLIQSLYRGRSARKCFTADVSRLVFLQACARRRVAQNRYQVLFDAVCSIQRTWRAVRSRRTCLQREMQFRAALKIQSAYRGWVGRRAYELDVHRVVYIQARVRRNQATKQYGELRRMAVALQRRWRRTRAQQSELKMRAVVTIQRRWRGHHERMLYQSTLQLRLECAVSIQRWWRGTMLLRSLRLERWVQEQAVTCIQAHFRGGRARRGLQLHHHAAARIQSAYRSYVYRKNQPKVELIKQQLCHALQQPVEIKLDLVDDKSPFPDGQTPHGEPLREEAMNEVTGERNATLTVSPSTSSDSLIVAGYSGYTEAESSRGHGHLLTGRFGSPVTEDWNDVRIEELDQCLDTCLAVLPLVSSATSRQPSLSFEVGSRSLSMDELDTATSSRPADTLQTERTVESAMPNKDETPQDCPRVSAANQDVQTSSEGGAAALNAHSGLPQELLHAKESIPLRQDGYRKHTRSLSKDEERLHQFAQVFLTLRQISNQQQRAQAAPPFPPSLTPPCSQTSFSQTPPSPPFPEVGVTGREEHCCLDIDAGIEHSMTPPPPSPAQTLNSLQPQMSSHGADVVLNMAELLKTLEQYCDGEDAGCSGMGADGGDLENGRSWGVRKSGFNVTSASALGIKHLKLPDVNAVLIVLVAMVVYTRTVCRDVFFGTKQSHRKH